MLTIVEELHKLAICLFRMTEYQIKKPTVPTKRATIKGQIIQRIVTYGIVMYW